MYRMNIRSRSWCFTTNNYSVDDISVVEDIATTSVYLIYGKEVAPTTGTGHLQGYIYFENSKSFSKIKKMLPSGSHIEVAKGSPQENQTYCSKEKDYKEFGSIPSQGKRNDIQVIKDDITQGKGMRDIIETATSYQSLKCAELMLKYKEQKRNWKPTVVWYHGESGCGKTRKAYELMPDCYRKTNSTGKWWDGYDAHKDILMDDIKDCSKEMYIFLLELLDRYDCRVESKGGSRQILATRIILTSIQNPLDMFAHFGNAEELKRRIDEIIEII